MPSCAMGTRPEVRCEGRSAGGWDGRPVTSEVAACRRRGGLLRRCHATTGTPRPTTRSMPRVIGGSLRHCDPWCALAERGTGGQHQATCDLNGRRAPSTEHHAPGDGPPPATWACGGRPAMPPKYGATCDCVRPRRAPAMQRGVRRATCDAPRSSARDLRCPAKFGAQRQHEVCPTVAPCAHPQLLAPSGGTHHVAAVRSPRRSCTAGAHAGARQRPRQALRLVARLGRSGASCDPRAGARALSITGSLDGAARTRVSVCVSRETPVAEHPREAAMQVVRHTGRGRPAPNQSPSRSRGRSHGGG